jgi:hypothetical protein
MDLLQHYDTSSSEDDNDDNCQKKRPTEDCTASTITDRQKRPRGSVTIVSERDAASQSLFVRTQPHIRGNWAGHVFVRIPISATTTSGTGVPSEEESSSSSSDDECDTDSSWQSTVNKSIATYRNDLERAGYTGTLVQHTHCHLSLSRPFYLQVASIDSFVDQLTARLQLCPVTTIRILSSNNYGDSSMSNSSSNSNSSNILVNDDCSRSFWTWPVQVQHTVQLLQMVQAVNAVLQSYHQPVILRSTTLSREFSLVCG